MKISEFMKKVDELKGAVYQLDSDLYRVRDFKNGKFIIEQIDTGKYDPVRLEVPYDDIEMLERFIRLVPETSYMACGGCDCE